MDKHTIIFPIRVIIINLHALYALTAVCETSSGQILRLQRDTVPYMLNLLAFIISVTEHELLVLLNEINPSELNSHHPQPDLLL